MLNGISVVVYMNLAGLHAGAKLMSEQLRIFPVPADEKLEISVQNSDLLKEFRTLAIYNNLGELMKVEELRLRDNVVRVNTAELRLKAFLRYI